MESKLFVTTRAYSMRTCPRQPAGRSQQRKIREPCTHSVIRAKPWPHRRTRRVAIASRIALQVSGVALAHLESARYGLSVKQNKS